MFVSGEYSKSMNSNKKKNHLQINVAVNTEEERSTATNITDVYSYQSGARNWHKYAMVEKRTRRKVFHFISFVSIKSNGNLRCLIFDIGRRYACIWWMKEKSLANCCLLLLSTISVNGNANGSFGRKIDLCEHNWHSNWPIMGLCHWCQSIQHQ